jgi:hypothetical protein
MYYLHWQTVAISHCVNKHDVSNKEQGNFNHFQGIVGGNFFYSLPF